MVAGVEDGHIMKDIEHHTKEFALDAKSHEDLLLCHKGGT